MYNKQKVDKQGPWKGETLGDMVRVIRQKQYTKYRSTPSNRSRKVLLRERQTDRQGMIHDNVVWTTTLKSPYKIKQHSNVGFIQDVQETL